MKINKLEAEDRNSILQDFLNVYESDAYFCDDEKREFEYLPDIELQNFRNIIKEEQFSIELQNLKNEIKEVIRLRNIDGEVRISEHQKTRQFISERFDELAKHDDLIKARDEIIESLKLESQKTQEELQNQINELKHYLNKFLPYKRAFRVSSYFLALFAFSTLSELLLGIVIIKPFWSTLGLAISGAFLLMSYYLFVDFKRSKDA